MSLRVYLGLLAVVALVCPLSAVSWGEAGESSGQVQGQVVTFVVNDPVNYFVISAARGRIHTLHFPSEVRLGERFKTLTDDGPIAVRKVADQIVAVAVKAHTPIGTSVNFVLHSSEFSVNLTFEVSGNPEAPPLAGLFITQEQARAIAAQVSPREPKETATPVAAQASPPEPEPEEEARQASSPEPQQAARKQLDPSSALRRSLRALRNERNALKAQIATLKAEHARTVEQLTVDNAALTDRIAALETLIVDMEAVTARQDQEITELLAQLAEQDAQPRNAIAMIDTSKERWLLDEAAKVQPHRRIPGKLGPQRGPHIKHAEWKLVGTEPVLEYLFINDDPRPFLLSGVQMLDEHREKDHAGMLKLDEQHVLTDSTGPIAVIAPRSSIKMSVVIRDHEAVHSHFVLAVNATETHRQVWVDPVPTWKLVEDPPPPDENEGKVTVSVLATYGAVWIPNPQPLAGELDATSIQGYGARLSYGLHKRFTVEIDALLASTGEATFADGGARSATLGRVQAGGQLRLGTGSLIPVLRGGVGLQGSSYSGVGDGFEFDLTWQVGGGVELKAGPFVLGVGVAGGKAMDRPSGWFEGGLQLGYAWKP